MATDHFATSGTTSFVSDAKVVESSTAQQIPKSALLPIRDQSIAEFLAKPYIIGSGSWTTSSTAATNLNGTGIGRFLQAGIGPDIWTSKVKGFQNIRATAVVRVVINSNPFQAGKLICYFVPGAAHTNTFNYILCREQMTCLPNVEIDCRDGVGVLRIPYIAPTQFFNMSTGIFDWGAIYLNVLSPLVTGSSGETDINYTIFLSFEDVELATPLYPQSGNVRAKSHRPAKMRPVGTTSKESEVMSQGSISKSLASVSAIAQDLAAVPMLTAIAEPASWVLRGLSGVASFFGYSKPESDAPTTLVAKRLIHNFASSSGASTAMPLTFSHDNALSISSTFAGTEADEMSFAYIKSRPAFFSSFSWPTSTAADNSLKTLTMYPVSFKETFTITHTSAKTYQCLVPFAYLGQYFGYYRGSIRLILKFVKTDFHTGRLLVTYTPSDYNVATYPTNSQSSYSIREIVDIKGRSEIELTIPYLSNQPWKNCNEPYGYLDFRVLNELRAPETASSSIQVLMYACAEQDFEYNGLGAGGGNIGLPFAPQMDTSDSTLVKEVIGGYSKPPTTIQPSSDSFGEMFTSVKQLINKYTPLLFNSSRLASGFTTGTNSCFSFYPWSFQACSADPTTNNVIYPTYFGDFLSMIAPGYALFRGSLRLALSDQLTTTSLVAATFDASQYTTFSTANFTTQTAPNTPAAGQMFASVANTDTTINLGPVAVSDAYNGPHEFKLPYYARTFCSWVTPYPVVYGSTTTINGYSNDVSQPTSAVSFVHEGTANTGVRIFRSACDDFQLGYFIGFPPIRVT